MATRIVFDTNDAQVAMMEYIKAFWDFSTRNKIFNILILEEVYRIGRSQPPVGGTDGQLEAYHRCKKWVDNELKKQATLHDIVAHDGHYHRLPKLANYDDNLEVIASDLNVTVEQLKQKLSKGEVENENAQ